MVQVESRTSWRRLFALALITVVAAVMLGPQIVKAQPAAQGANLLVNPGFEPFTTPDGKYDYPLYVTQEGGGHVAEGWSPWWLWSPDADPMKSYIVPEFDIAPIYRDPWRVRSGNASQQIFRPSTLWLSGVYQRVQVPTNARLSFTIYGHTWAGFCKPTEGGGPECGDNHDSNYGLGANPTRMRVGIDPTGGTDWRSSNIVWSQDYNIHDYWAQLAVDAQAQGQFVTVFTYTTFEFPAVINNVYWDDAALVVTTGGAAAPAPVQPVQPAQPPSSGDSSSQLLEAKWTINVRSGAGTTNPVIAQIRPGTKYQVTGQSDQWYQIAYGSQIGYVYAPLVFISPANLTPGSGVEALYAVNVRVAPGTGNRIIGVITPGTIYPVVGQSQGWYQIQYKDQTGWVSGQFVTVR